jgi:release factor glutamine methyltransferase
MSNKQAGVVVRRALAEAAAQLGTSSETPRLDAELLMAHALGVSREELLLRHMDASAPPAFEALLARRRSGEPIAYITGRRAFWSIELEVGPGVLIPRPDSETLIEAAAHHFRGRAPARILDLGTGPGTLLLAAMAEWPEAAGLGVDRSAAALAFAERNARRLGLAARFVQSDWGDGVTGTFDLILCNPPYVEAGADLPRDVAAFEPAEALYAGPEGLDDYRRIAPRIGGLLAPGGLACIEIGAGQAEAVTALFGAEGLAVSARADLAGILRCLLVSR